MVFKMELFSIKNRSTNRCGIQYLKSYENERKSMRKRCRILSEIWWIPKGRFAKNRVLWKRCKHANHYIHAVEYGSGRVRRKRRKSKEERNLKKNVPKNMKKHARKSDARIMKRLSKMEPAWAPKSMNNNPTIDWTIDEKQSTFLRNSEHSGIAKTD